MIQHHILVKFIPETIDKETLISEICALFASATQIEGITKCEVIPNCIPRANRYDVMIRLEMSKDALGSWDASQLHSEWKKRFCPLAEAKAIFDSEI